MVSVKRDQCNFLQVFVSSGQMSTRAVFLTDGEGDDLGRMPMSIRIRHTELRVQHVSILNVSAGGHPLDRNRTRVSYSRPHSPVAQEVRLRPAG